METSTENNAMQIVRCSRSKSLKESTLRNLVNECQVKTDREFYRGLDWLVKKEKVLLLITPADTYVLPLIKENSKN